MDKARNGRRWVRWALGILASGLLVGLAACAQGGGIRQTPPELTYWKELTGLLQPVELKTMTDHRAYMLPSGHMLALHFDNMDLQKAQHLNWVVLGIPGRYCKEDQERIEKQFGRGFTHFHDLKADTHGGRPGAEGIWFMHTAVREFTSPMSGGPVKPGVDERFFPTRAPEC